MEQSARKSSGENIDVDLGVENVVKAQFSMLILNIYCAIKTTRLTNCAKFWFIVANSNLFAYQRPKHSFGISQFEEN